MGVISIKYNPQGVWLQLALVEEGELTGIVLYHEIDAVPVEECTRLIIKTAAKCKREYIPLHGKIRQWMQLLS